MLRNTYSPLSKFNSWAFIRISLTESAEAHNTTTEIKECMFSMGYHEEYNTVEMNDNKQNTIKIYTKEKLVKILKYWFVKNLKNTFFSVWFKKHSKNYY